jgi:hypothetical protein
MFIGWGELSLLPFIIQEHYSKPHGGAELTGDYEWCVGANFRATLELILWYYPTQTVPHFPIVNLHNMPEV